MVGEENTGGIIKRNSKAVLANRLLAFVATGLSTSFKIPVVFFFVRRLSGTKLHKLTCHVIKELELEGFPVERIVIDNASTNVKMFKCFGNGKVVPFVAHPLDRTRKLFLSYDYTHLIKNLRNLFIDRTFDVCGQNVSFTPIVKVREIKKKYAIFRPMRKLTSKHTQTNSLDKLKVKFAKDIFSKDMIATLKLFQNYDVAGFADIDATIEFLEINCL
ncbi:hypothetical protein GHT06_004413 [Daphnia sinensis]|uniref:Transposase n=1 Tax=Daphnia sinensis TaxID=1820382 RepID=A0AAD5KFB8_9CRUS|nr:hypothetical protein GHT06_004413 [Daphnia sinensis]